MTCNKICFEKSKEAYAFIATTKARNHVSSKQYANKKLKPYLCKGCGKWHLTSKGKAKGKKLKTRKKQNEKRQRVDEQR